MNLTYFLSGETHVRMTGAICWNKLCRKNQGKYLSWNTENKLLRLHFLSVFCIVNKNSLLCFVFLMWLLSSVNNRIIWHRMKNRLSVLKNNLIWQLILSTVMEWVGLEDNILIDNKCRPNYPTKCCLKVTKEHFRPDCSFYNIDFNVCRTFRWDEN